MSLLLPSLAGAKVVVRAETQTSYDFATVMKFISPSIELKFDLFVFVNTGTVSHDCRTLIFGRLFPVKRLNSARAAHARATKY